MIILLVLLLSGYLAIVHLVSVVVRTLRPGYAGAGITGGALLAAGVTFVIVVAAVLLFESDESYWYYGPDWRMWGLGIGTMSLSVAIMVLGPLAGVWYRKRCRKLVKPGRR
jgi:hypothetical protein